MRRFGIALLYAVIGYVIAAIAAYLLVGWLSPNQHDRSIEAAMTSVFFFGPVGAVLAFIVGFIRAGRAPRSE